MLISKKFSFDAAHFLPYYDGKCRNVHGHRWYIEVACSGKVDDNSGMVVDFTVLKQFCNDIKLRYDHGSLNDHFENPTAENIGRDILSDFTSWCKDKGLLSEYVRVWESEDSMVELRRDYLTDIVRCV